MVPIPVVRRPIVTVTSAADAAAAVDRPVVVAAAVVGVVVAMETIVIGEVAVAAHVRAAVRHVPAAGADRAIVTAWSAARATRSGIANMNVSDARRACPRLRRSI